MVIVLDADDTLWITQQVYDQLKHRFVSILEGEGIHDSEAITRLDDIDRARLSSRGLIPERFIESMLVTYEQLCAEHGVPQRAEVRSRIWELRYWLDQAPELYPETRDVLDQLSNDGYQLVMYTAAGNREHQLRRIDMSGIAQYFHVIHIVAWKDEASFRALLKQLGKAESPQDVVMVGNSYKSDIVPARNCGARAVLIDRGDWQNPNPVEVDPDVPVLASLHELPSLMRLTAESNRISRKR